MPKLGTWDRIVALSIPIEDKLRLLRDCAKDAGHDEALSRWAQHHPRIAMHDNWCERAWWGVAAGELVRKNIYDPSTHDETLGLLLKADWQILEEARRAGPFIIATAHLGPPQFLMNALTHTGWFMLFWTNMSGKPSWFYAGRESMFLDPVISSGRSMLLVKSALHLRSGGILLGAADHPSGERTIAFEQWGRRWQFSLGLPTLSRQLNIPFVFCLALWSGERVLIQCSGINVPDQALPEQQWHEEWVRKYWAFLEPIIRNSPENLRFMRQVVHL